LNRHAGNHSASDTRPAAPWLPCYHAATLTTGGRHSGN
jgi:hypothetical protein